MTATVLLNGEFLSEPEAGVSVYDGGWLHGAGLFETMRAENGRVFRLEAHIDRLRCSAQKLLTTMERDRLPSASEFCELLKRNELGSARVRMTVTIGRTHAGAAAETPRLTVCVTAASLSAYPPDFFEKGVPVVVCDSRVSPSDPLAGHKTTCYLPRLLGLRQAQKTHAVEALWFTTANRLAEGSISNVFVLRHGVLQTPSLDTPVLPGIARGVVLEIARELGRETEECSLTIDDLLDAEEVLLTNTIMQVMPVIRVEKHDIAEGRVGPVARQLLAEFRRVVRKECRQT